MFKSRFKGNEIKIIVYGQYLLNYETPIKENASRLARRHTLFCQYLERRKFSGLPLYGGPQLSRQKQNARVTSKTIASKANYTGIKSKTIASKAKSWRQKRNSRVKSKPFASKAKQSRQKRNNASKAKRSRQKQNSRVKSKVHQSSSRDR